MKMSKLPKLIIWTEDDSDEVVISNDDKDLTEAQAAEIFRRVEAYEGLTEALNNLSKWAAAIHWDRKKNTQDWMDGLRERIEKAEQALEAK